MLSLVSSVEANWPAVYTVGGALLLAGFGASRVGPMLICAGINLAIFLGLALYAHAPVLAISADIFGLSNFNSDNAVMPAVFKQERPVAVFHLPIIGGHDWCLVNPWRQEGHRITLFNSSDKIRIIQWFGRRRPRTKVIKN